jgi:predicted ATP-dependent protease
MRPQAIPIDVKIALIGDGYLYQMLAMYDEDFWEIFKVKADFNYELARTKQNMMEFAAFIACCCEEEAYTHFDPSGVAMVVEYASRIVADQEKLSSRFAWIKTLVEEADYWANQEKATMVSAVHVDKAIAERQYRHNLPDEQIRESMERGQIMIDTDGEVVGQANGLSVYSLGDYVFGRPSRITCKTFMGQDGVINIEREAKMSGRIHDKGVLILSGYLGWKYAQEIPLSLSASLCFEQSYGGVDGDSASSVELYVLLSSIGEIPLRQNIAVTGSINQKGEIQPIGGVNEKIEGFYRLCKAKGLNGEQGVMVPASNVVNLMLDKEVVESVKEKKFQIYAVKTVDEGIELLTGLPAGERDEKGAYAPGSVNFLVEKRLREMAEKLKEFSDSTKKKHDKEND